MKTTITSLCVLAALGSIAWTNNALAHTMEVKPFLQTATPQSIWINWETGSGSQSIVEWGLSTSLGQSTSGSAKTGFGLSRIHEVQLTGLAPNTVYYYRVKTDNTYSDIYQFKTPALSQSEQHSRILAMSDMQYDSGNPSKFKEVIEQGVIPYVSEVLGKELHEGINMTLIPGDLVADGTNYLSWRTTFFSPIAPLAAKVPTYPAPGNHEYNTDTYFKFFTLPQNGTPNYMEHWYYHDQSNIRVISMDSNSNYRIQAQLDWLDNVLADTCSNQQIDFVFAQMHHPHKSEMWVEGELDYSGQIVAKLEQFSSACSKPSIHFFGHTHAYSRGVSRDHAHAMVNVASAGGNLDYFGEYKQADYPEFAVSQDEYGFVLVDVTAGDDPSFEIKRISRGDESRKLNNVERDSLKIRKNNTKPYQPEILWPSSPSIDASCSTMVASLFADADKDRFGGAHWQLSHDCNDFSNPIVDSWYQDKNIWDEKDTRAGMAPNRFDVGSLVAGQQYCVRTRFRDASLAWSDWSQPKAFSATGGSLTANLLQNPGAEDGTTHWQGTGPIESLTNNQCDAVTAHSGSRFFAVGGVCAGESQYGEAFERVDLTSYSANIDAGTVQAHFGGLMRNYNGSDKPELLLIFKDASLNTLSTTTSLSSQTASWQQKSAKVNVPVNTRYVDFVLKGTRFGGSDNDSYFDDLSLQLNLSASQCATVNDAPPTGAPATHVTQLPVSSGNLLQNPDAEAGTNGWSGAGPIESLQNNQCDSIPAYQGARFFAVGGICSGESASGSAWQRISVQQYAALIANGQAQVYFGGYMRDYSGNDIPAIELTFIDKNGNTLATSQTLSNQTSSWQLKSHQQLIPVGTAFIDFTVSGSRNHGSDNDSYFDNLELKVLVD